MAGYFEGLERGEGKRSHYDEVVELKMRSNVVHWDVDLSFGSRLRTLASSMQRGS